MSTDYRPSNKIGWFKAMMAKINNENRLMEEAYKVAENSKYQPKITISKKAKAKTQFAAMLEEAQEEVDQRRNKAKKVSDKKKEVDNSNKI